MPSQLAIPEKDASVDVPLVPAATALLNELKATLQEQSFSDHELAEISGALERFSARDGADEDGRSAGGLHGNA